MACTCFFLLAFLLIDVTMVFSTVGTSRQGRCALDVRSPPSPHVPLVWAGLGMGTVTPAWRPLMGCAGHNSRLLLPHPLTTVFTRLHPFMRVRVCNTTPSSKSVQYMPLQTRNKRTITNMHMTTRGYSTPNARPTPCGPSGRHQSRSGPTACTSLSRPRKPRPRSRPASSLPTGPPPWP